MSHSSVCSIDDLDLLILISLLLSIHETCKCVHMNILCDPYLLVNLSIESIYYSLPPATILGFNYFETKNDSCRGINTS